MAHWNRARGYDNPNREIERNYADVEFANQPDSERREYQRDLRRPGVGHYLSDAAETDHRDYGRFGDDRMSRDREFAQTYDAATRDYAGYGDVYAGEGGYIPPRYAAGRYDRASMRDEGRYTDRSAYNPESEGVTYGPDEFRRGRRVANTAYGPRGAQSRPEDYYRNRSELYDGRPEARGWHPDEETSAFGPHRGKGPKDYKRSDERIRDDINDRLTDDHALDASSITVAVKDGEATLSGNVDSKFAKRRAEDIADMATGVKHVQNNLRVNAGSAMMPSAGTTASGIESASNGRGASVVGNGGTTSQQQKQPNGTGTNTSYG
jgi:osmotically-inducible protein OsmY